MYWITVLRGNVNAGMEGAFTTEWIHSFAKAARQMPDHRPERRRGRHIAKSARRQKLETAGRQHRSACVLFEEVEFRYGMLKASCRTRRRLVQPEWTLA